MPVLKQAVVIGLNYAGSANQLPGSVNAARGWVKLLKQRGYLVNALIEDAATRVNMAYAITSMFDAAQTGPGNPCGIVYCGHGIEIDYQPPGQARQLIHAIVPWDAINNYNMTIPTYQWSAKMTQRGRARLWTIMDVCYAAGFRAIEDLLQAKGKPPVPQFLPRGTVDERFHDFGGAPKMGFAELFTDTPWQNYVSLHASGENEVSFQRRYGGQWYPDLSYACLRVMQEDKFKNATWGGFFGESRRRVSAISSANPVAAGDPALLRKRAFT